MSDQPDRQIPPVIAEAPGELPTGDYLAPPRVLPGHNLTTARSIALVLLIGAAFIQGEKTVNVLFHVLTMGSFGWFLKVVVGIGALVLQGLAIFGSRRWPTYALWLALAGAIASMAIIN